jgi:DNA polymerase III alpha subunit
MTHANIYLELIGTDASEELQQAMGWLAHGFIKARGVATSARTPGADLFAADGLEPDSIQLIASNAFGYEQLNQIYTAEYLIDGTRLTAFVSDRPTVEAASAMAVEYSQTLISYGATAVDVPPFIDDATVMQFFDTYEIVFSRDLYLAGVHEAANLDAAMTLARRLDGHLETHESK